VTCLLAPKIACSWRGAGGSCGRDTSATDCIMDSRQLPKTPAQRMQRERDTRRHGERQRAASDAGLASDATVLTPRLDADLAQHGGNLPLDHHERGDLSNLEKLLAWLAIKTDVAKAAEVKELIFDPPEEDQNYPWTRSDYSVADRLFIWGSHNLSGEQKSDFENLVGYLFDELYLGNTEVSQAADGRSEMSVAQQVLDTLRAEREVTAVVALPATIAYDSADGIYRAGLAELGFSQAELSGLYGNGAATVFRFAAAQRSQQSAAGSGSSNVFSGGLRLASDSASRNEMADAFPGYDRISRQG